MLIRCDRSRTDEVMGAREAEYLFLVGNCIGNRADGVMDVSQTIGKGVDLVQQRGQSVDGGAEEREDEGFSRGDVLVEFPVSREGVRVVDA